MIAIIKFSSNVREYFQKNVLFQSQTLLDRLIGIIESCLYNKASFFDTIALLYFSYSFFEPLVELEKKFRYNLKNLL